MQRLDAQLVEQVLRRLQPASLAAAEATCKQWAHLIEQHNLWRIHATRAISNQDQQCSSAASSSVNSVNWREICFQRAAAAKWRSGKLLLSATLQGHTAAVTCLTVLQDIIATGSTDSTARIWNLTQQSQLHVLQHADTVVAVGLPSVSLCVTATATAAFLWRDGKRVRRFDVMPGGSITCLALTDTRLLLGTTGGTLQQFDLFSGRPQLITRHGSGVTCLLAQQQQQQQEGAGRHQQLLEHYSEEWTVIVGTVEGQVSCFSVGTGRILWQLPNKYPSRVVSLHIQQYQRQLGANAPPHQQSSCQGDEPGQLLHVLNSRSQLIVWQLRSSNSSSSGCSHGQGCIVLPTCNHCVSSLACSTSQSSGPGPQTRHVPAATATTFKHAVAHPGEWQVEATNRNAAASTSLNSKQGSLNSSSSMWPTAVCELPVPPARQLMTNLQAQITDGCTCMVCPEYGSSCLIVGSSDGFLSVAELLHSKGSCCYVNNTCGGSSSGSCSRGLTDGYSVDCAGRTGQQRQPVALTQQPAEQAVPALMPNTSYSGSPAAERTAVREGDASTRGSSCCQIQLALVRRCSLTKVAQLVASRSSKHSAASRNCAVSAPPRCSGGRIKDHESPTAALLASSSGVIHSLRHYAFGHGGSVKPIEGQNSTVAVGCDGSSDGAAVRCAVFTDHGQLAAGLASGHVCLLKFKATTQLCPGSIWP